MAEANITKSALRASTPTKNQMNTIVVLAPNSGGLGKANWTIASKILDTGDNR